MRSERCPIASELEGGPDVLIAEAIVSVAEGCLGGGEGIGARETFKEIGIEGFHEESSAEIVHLPEAEERGASTDDGESALETVDAFSALDVAEADLTSGENDDVGAVELESGGFCGGEDGVVCVGERFAVGT